MKKYKHGDKIRNWKFKVIFHYNQQKHSFKQFTWWSRGEYVQTDERCFYGIPYRFRVDPVPHTGGFRKILGTRCMNNGHGRGTPWKKAYIRDKAYQREIKERYSVTFTMPDFIPYKNSRPQCRTWKRCKKDKQWMKNTDQIAINKKFKGMKPAEMYNQSLF